MRISKPFIINTICIKTGGNSVVKFVDFLDNENNEPYTNIIYSSIFTEQLLDKLIMYFLDYMACMKIDKKDNVIHPLIYKLCIKDKITAHTFLISDEFKYRKLIDKEYNEIELNIRYIDTLLVVNELNRSLKET